MVRAKNYETASTFVKVIPRKLLASFFPDTVYMAFKAIVLLGCNSYSIGTAASLGIGLAVQNAATTVHRRTSSTRVGNCVPPVFPAT